MHVVSTANAPKRQRDGLVSYILLQKGDIPDSQLSITWVEVEPGGRQQPHRHEPEQTYIIVQGRGNMHVGEESSQVQRGDLVYVPPMTTHSIENDGEGILVYISASTPAYDFENLYDEGELKG